MIALQNPNFFNDLLKSVGIPPQNDGRQSQVRCKILLAQCIATVRLIECVTFLQSEESNIMASEAAGSVASSPPATTDTQLLILELIASGNYDVVSVKGDFKGRSLTVYDNLIEGVCKRQGNRIPGEGLPKREAKIEILGAKNQLAHQINDMTSLNARGVVLLEYDPKIASTDVQAHNHSYGNKKAGKGRKVWAAALKLTDVAKKALEARSSSNGKHSPLMPLPG